jgi:hypothetical protein
VRRLAGILQADNLGTFVPRFYAICFRSQRCASASQTQSVNNQFRSGKSGSPLTKKPKRSQSSSPGHLPVPYLPPRIVRVEVRAPQRLPTAMVTAFDVAARAMAFADRRAAIGTGSEFLAHVGRSKTAGCHALRSPLER